MTESSIELIMAIVAVIIGGIGLTIATIALALIVGVKNSTHQVVWKPMEEPSEKAFDDEDEMSPEEIMELINPNKKIKKEAEEPKEDTEFVDLSNPEVTSNQW